MSRLTDYLWRKVAAFAARPAVAGWLIRRAVRTPFTHIGTPDDMYMERYWLFNPYPADKKSWRRLLPSVRIHRICREDRDPNHHDHPWNARTIILKGWYLERRLQNFGMADLDVRHARLPGDTAAIRFGEYHTIDKVSVRETWTLFITWKYQGTWGFWVDGVKVPYKKYFALQPLRGATTPKEKNEQEA